MTLALMNSAEIKPLVAGGPLSAESTTLCLTLSALKDARVSLIGSKSHVSQRTIATSVNKTDVLQNMRNIIGIPGGPDYLGMTTSQAKATFSMILKRLMDKIIVDIKAMQPGIEWTGNSIATVMAHNAADRHNSFIHDLMTIYKVAVSDICPVAPFFNIPSGLYKPPGDHFFIATLQAYEHKIGRVSDNSCQQELFHYCLGGLKDSVTREAMSMVPTRLLAAMDYKQGPLADFIMGIMTPALLKAAFQTLEGGIIAFPYLLAVGEQIGRLGFDTNAATFANVSTIMYQITESLQHLRAGYHAHRNRNKITKHHILMIITIAQFINKVLQVILGRIAQRPLDTQQIHQSLGMFRNFAASAIEYMEKQHGKQHGMPCQSLCEDFDLFFSGLGEPALRDGFLSFKKRYEGFAAAITLDIQKSWFLKPGGTVEIRTGNGQHLAGTIPNTMPSEDELYLLLFHELRTFILKDEQIQSNLSNTLRQNRRECISSFFTCIV